MIQGDLDHSSTHFSRTQVGAQSIGEQNGGTGADRVGEAEMTQGEVVIIIDEPRDAAGMSRRPWWTGFWPTAL